MVAPMLRPGPNTVRRAEALARTGVARVQSELVKHDVPARAFSERRNLRRVLLVSERNSISRSQIHPFWFYWWELRSRGFELREVAVDAYAAAPERAPGAADVVVVQTWFTLEQERLLELLRAIRQQNPSAKLCFFDAFAPTDLRLASVLDPFVDVYVKKCVLRDRSRYLKSTRGDTNLTDYYGPYYGVEEPEVFFPIPDGFLRKLVVGPGFATGETMLSHFYWSDTPMRHPASIDVHARLGHKGSPWYTAMRQHSLRALSGLADRRVVTGPGMKQKQYLRELASSRICFSPFGYGEITWRDYEAALCGALLVKPDMSHCETDPELFLPGETYVPVAWDFSDLEEKVRHYLSHESEARRIVERAYRVLHDYARNKAFVRHMRPVLEA